MPLLIDGYNLLHATGIMGRGSGPGGFQRSRLALLNFLAASIEPAELAHTTVVFDAREAPWGLPRVMEHQRHHRPLRREIRLGRRTDRRIDPAPRRPRGAWWWFPAITQIQRAARRRRAKAVDSDVWYAELVRARRERIESAADAPARPAVPLLDRRRQLLAPSVRRRVGPERVPGPRKRRSSRRLRRRAKPDDEQSSAWRSRAGRQPLSARLWRGFVAGTVIWPAFLTAGEQTFLSVTCSLDVSGQTGMSVLLTVNSLPPSRVLGYNPL